MNRQSPILLSLASLFCISLVVANIIAGKLWDVGFLGIVLTAGVINFPIVYIIGDVIPEVYGLKVARRVIWLGFATNLFAVFFFLLTIALPYPPFWQNQEAFAIVLGFTPRLLVASFLGYLVGTNANALVLTWVKSLTGPKHLWLRTTTSTIVGEGLDSIIFMSVAFYGIVPNEALPTMIASQWLFKSAYEFLATPVTYWVVNRVKRLEKVDQFAESVVAA